MSNIEPMGEHILVKILETMARRTSAGIYLPDTVQESCMEAEVVAIGPGFLTVHGERVPNKLRPGDKVLIPRMPQGSHYHIDNVRHVFMTEREVYARVARAGEERPSSSGSAS